MHALRLTPFALLLLVSCDCGGPPQIVDDDAGSPFQPVADAGPAPRDGGDVEDAGTPSPTPNPTPSPEDAGPPDVQLPDPPGFDSGPPPGVLELYTADVLIDANPDIHHIAVTGALGDGEVDSVLLDIYDVNDVLLAISFEVPAIVDVEQGRFAAQTAVSGVSALNVGRYEVRVRDSLFFLSNVLVANPRAPGDDQEACPLPLNGNIPVCGFQLTCHRDDDELFLGTCGPVRGGPPVLIELDLARVVPPGSGFCIDDAFPDGVQWRLAGTNDEAITALEMSSPVTGPMPIVFPSVDVGQPPVFIIEDGLCFGNAGALEGQPVTFRVLDAAGRASNALTLTMPDDLDPPPPDAGPDGGPPLAPATIQLFTATESRDPNAHSLYIRGLAGDGDPNRILVSIFDAANEPLFVGIPFQPPVVRDGVIFTIQLTLADVGNIGAARYTVSVEDTNFLESDPISADLAPIGQLGGDCAVPTAPVFTPCAEGLLCEPGDPVEEGSCAAPIGGDPVVDEVLYIGLELPPTTRCADETFYAVNWILRGDNAERLAEFAFTSPAIGAAELRGPFDFFDEPPAFDAFAALCFLNPNDLASAPVTFTVYDEAGRASMPQTIVMPPDVFNPPPPPVDAGPDAGFDAGVDAGAPLDGGAPDAPAPIDAGIADTGVPTDAGPAG